MQNISAIISIAEYYKRNEAKKELAKRVLDFLDVVADVQQDFHNVVLHSARG
jgi:hypothetical protein